MVFCFNAFHYPTHAYPSPALSEFVIAACIRCLSLCSEPISTLASISHGLIKVLPSHLMRALNCFCQMALQADHTFAHPPTHPTPPLSVIMAFFITIFYLFDQFPNDFDMLDSLSVRVNRENRVAKSLFDSTWAHHSHFVCSASLTSQPPNLSPLCPSLNLLFLLLPLAACIKHLPSFSFIWIEKLFAAICYASLENKQEKNNQKKM